MGPREFARAAQILTDSLQDALVEVETLHIRMLAKTGETQRRRESQRIAEASFSLRFSAFLCVSAFSFISRLFNFGKQPDKQGRNHPRKPDNAFSQQFSLWTRWGRRVRAPGLQEGDAG